MPRPLRPLVGAQCPARPPKRRRLARAPEALSGEFVCPGHEAWGPVTLGSTHATTRRGVKVPTALAGPRTPVASPCSPVLASHDFVLVRDEFIYIFQIKLVRHGAATLGPAPSQLPTPPQPQLPPAGNVFPPTQARGRFPQQRRDALRRPSEGQISFRQGSGRSRRS